MGITHFAVLRFFVALVAALGIPLEAFETADKVVGATKQAAKASGAGSFSQQSTPGPRWCKALTLRESPYGVCSGNSTSNSWFPQTFDDGCSRFMILFLLLVITDLAQLLLPKLWISIAGLLPNTTNNRGQQTVAGRDTERIANIKAEVASLEQQHVQLQQQQQQYAPATNFAAYALLQRQIDKIIRAKEACLKQLHEQQQFSNNGKNRMSDNGLWASLVWPILKAALLANIWSIAKPVTCWLLFTAVLGATVELPTAQLAPLDAFGPKLALTFPLAYVICRTCLDSVYGQFDLLRPRIGPNRELQHEPKMHFS